MDTTPSGDFNHGVAALPFTPAYSPNAFFLAVFILLFLGNLLLIGTFWRYWGHAIGMFSGLLLELLGYAAKVQLSHNRYNKSAYIMYIIGLTLGPTFLSASLYLCCGRLQREFSLKPAGCFGPQLSATVFILGDFLCLCFIGVGGSLAAIYSTLPIGVDLMIAGLATQVLVTAIFCAYLVWITSRSSKLLIDKYTRYYIVGASVAAICLFVRSCWRVAELSGGFNGPLTGKEGIFIGLESVPMFFMSMILTALHPGLWFQDSGITRFVSRFARRRF